MIKKIIIIIINVRQLIRCAAERQRQYRKATWFGIFRSFKTNFAEAVVSHGDVGQRMTDEYSAEMQLQQVYESAEGLSSSVRQIGLVHIIAWSPRRRVFHQNGDIQRQWTSTHLLQYDLDKNENELEIKGHTMWGPEYTALTHWW